MHEPAVRTVDQLVEAVRTGTYGPDPARERIALAFTTAQAVRTPAAAADTATRCSACASTLPSDPAPWSRAPCPRRHSTTVSEPRWPNSSATRCFPCGVAALDAYLSHVRPHTPDHGARPYTLPAGSSLHRSRARARAVVDLLPATGIRRVLVIGVVNSLLEQLRARGLEYVPCDLKGGTTEWGEPVRTDALAELEHCDAVLASGMTLGNGSFQPLLDHAAATGDPLVMFAQTGSAVLPCFLGAGVSAVSAEPYPFFWLDGGPGVIHRYGGSTR
ncbi:conserved hypothetical protein [Streptomyces sp. C]|nr:conserved hypothetical protein [Streptomyces sp. C]